MVQFTSGCTCYLCGLDEYDAEYQLSIIERFTGAPPETEETEQELRFIQECQEYNDDDDDDDD